MRSLTTSPQSNTLNQDAVALTPTSSTTLLTHLTQKNLAPGSLESLSLESHSQAWLCALSSNYVYLNGLWQNSFSAFAPNFYEHFKSQGNDEALRGFLMQTFSTAMLMDSKKTTVVMSTEKGIDSLALTTHKASSGEHVSILAIRGTEMGASDGATSAMLAYATQKYPSFEKSWENLKPLADQLLQSHDNQYGASAELLLTGHSYGASLAEQAQVSYADTLNARAYTFASPGSGQAVWIYTGWRAIDTTQMIAKPIVDTIGSTLKTIISFSLGAIDYVLGVSNTGKSFQTTDSANVHGKTDPNASEQSTIHFFHHSDPVPKLGGFAGNVHKGHKVFLENPQVFSDGSFNFSNHSMQKYLETVSFSFCDRAKAVWNGTANDGTQTSIKNNSATLLAKEVYQKASALTEQAIELMEHTQQKAASIYQNATEKKLTSDQQERAQNINTLPPDTTSPESPQTPEEFRSSINTRINKTPAVPVSELPPEFNAKMLGLHAALSMARTALRVGGQTQMERHLKTLPDETPENYEQMLQMDFRDELDHATLSAALKGFRLRKNHFDPNVSDNPTQKMKKPS